jgi:DNA polymerase III subunit gamma/tau
MNGIEARPLTFDKVLGQERVKRLLQNTLRSGVLARAYLLSGGWSVGKTTLAGLFARSILCQHRDKETMSPCNVCPSCKNFLRGAHASYTEVDAANFGTKENMAAILSTLAYECGDGYRVIFLDEAHRISPSGKDALLKELETPVGCDNTIFLFSTNEPQKMPETLQSRCVRVPLEKPSVDIVLQKLTSMCTEGGVKFDRFALKNLAIWSQGHFRDAENAINPLVLMGGINADNVSAYTSYSQEGTAEMLLSLESDLSKALTLAEELISRYGSESIHSSIVRVLLEATQYGLSGMSLDTPDCIKTVYNAFGSRMGAILSHFVSRGKLSDGKFLQAELVHTHYRFIKGDMDIGKMSYVSVEGTSSKPAEVAASKVNKNPSTAESMREMKAQARKGGSGAPPLDERISEHWGQEEISDDSAVSLKRS